MKYKIAYLSIIWRASISKREMFSVCKFSNSHKENLRRMIYEYDPMDENDYPFLQYKLYDAPEYNLVFSPIYIPENNVVFFIGNGLITIFYLGIKMQISRPEIAVRTTNYVSITKLNKAE